MTPSLTEDQLHDLEAGLYARAMDGDSRLGLYLLRLYYKDLHMTDASCVAPIGGGVVVLPSMGDDDDYDQAD